MSEMTAPRGEVTIPMRLGKRGMGRLRAGSNRPSAASFFLSCFESELEGAVTLGFEELDQQLIFAAGLENIDTPARHNRHAVARLELEIPMGGAETHAPHLGLALLEREIVVAARGEFGAGDFARDPDVGKLAVENGANGRVELAHRVDAALGKKLEGELFHLKKSQES